MRYWPTKTPAEIRDQGLDWGPTLSKIGDPTIVGSVWTRLNGTVIVSAGAIEASLRKTVTRVAGGDPNSTTVFRNTVTLSNAAVLSEDVYQRVRA